MRVCVVVPVHNEARAIGWIVETVRKKDLDILVVDDGSVDNSGQIAQEKGAVVIRNEARAGKGFSLQGGFRYACEHHYDGVMTIDGDGQHDPADIDGFLKVIAQNPDCIVSGSRMTTPQGMPWLRYVTNRFMSFLISLICRQNIPDSQCGFRYISCNALRRLDLISRDFEIETEVLIKASRLGYRILTAPVKTIYRNEKSKINPFPDTVRFFAYLIKELVRLRS